MFEEFKARPLYIMDLIFAIIIGFFYLGFQIGLSQTGAYVHQLFIATFILLGISIMLFYLTISMNPKFASALHMFSFPLSGALYILTKWTPKATSEYAGNANSIYIGTLACLVVLLIYCSNHFMLQKLR